MIALTLAAMVPLLEGELVGPDAHITSVGIDSRQLSPGGLFVALRGANHDGHDFIAQAKQQGAAAALVSRPVAVDLLPQLRVADTRLALGRLGAAWRQRFTRPLVALTGSNGKTTVKEMIAAILRCRGRVLATTGNLNNDLGVPLTLLRLGDEDYAVVEMGANHVGEIAYLTGLARPDVALINNAGPAHLEGFGSLDGVARGKGEIYGGLGPDGVAIINRDDVYADYWSSLAGERRVIDFGLTRPAQVSGQILDASCNRFRLRAFRQQIDIELPLPGEHNICNALAAAAAGLAVGAGLEDIKQGLEGMHAVAGRLQRLPGPDGITLIHDAYNANPASLAAALNTLGGEAGVHWLVLGDMAELGPNAAELHEQAGRQARQADFQRCFALGEHSRMAVRSFGPGGVHYDSAEALIQALRESLAAGPEKPTVLVKGSRSMRMERIVQALIARADPSGEAHG
ncbi:MAG: UDP-N-acetylmuramoyl-tripeptide--D-alanyl-D-alanine ligase [Candidatus Competibacteraceae bacterium]